MRIREIKELLCQDINRAAIKHLGIIPYYYSSWVQDECELPASLYIICPVCFLDIRLENKRESISFEKGIFAHGNKWGYEIENYKKYILTSFFKCPSCRSILEISYDKGRNFFRVYQEEE